MKELSQGIFSDEIILKRYIENLEVDSVDDFVETIKNQTGAKRQYRYKLKKVDLFLAMSAEQKQYFYKNQEFI